MPEFDPREDYTKALTEAVDDMAIRDLAETLDAQAMCSGNRVIALPPHMASAVQAYEDAAAAKRAERQRERLALWRVEFTNRSRGSGASANATSGNINVAGYSIEDAVIKLRLGDKTFENCTIHSIHKIGFIDAGLSAELLVK